MVDVSPLLWTQAMTRNAVISTARMSRRIDLRLGKWGIFLVPSWAVKSRSNPLRFADIRANSFTAKRITWLADVLSRFALYHVGWTCGVDFVNGSAKSDKSSIDVRRDGLGWNSSRTFLQIDIDTKRLYRFFKDCSSGGKALSPISAKAVKSKI